MTKTMVPMKIPEYGSYDLFRIELQGGEVIEVTATRYGIMQLLDMLGRNTVKCEQLTWEELI